MDLVKGCCEPDEWLIEDEGQGLHLIKVEIFNREEDEKTGQHLFIDVRNSNNNPCDRSSLSMKFDDDLKGNPSLRRSAVVLHFQYEGYKGTSFKMAISQHKGGEFIKFIKGKKTLLNE